MGDNIKAPDHYCEGREYEPKDVIRDWGLNFNLGSAVKYISRAGRKGDKLEDLKKAKQFLQFEIEAVEEEASREEDEKRISAELLSRAVTENSMRFEDVPESLKPRVINNIAQEVLDSQIIPPDEVRAAVIDRIVGRIENGELDCFDISYNLYRAYQDIRDAVARQAIHKVGEAEREDLKHIVQKIDRGEIDCNVIPSELYSSYEDIRDAVERRTSWYTNGALGHWYYYQNIPDGYKARVIDRIVEMVRNGELDLMDIPNDLYDECVRSQAAIAKREYYKAMDALRQYAEDADDTVSINFEFEVDPEIDTDTVNVHVHIKNKED